MWKRTDSNADPNPLTVDCSGDGGESLSSHSRHQVKVGK